ncbi:MAG TPA: FHA domain-containing protein [Gemmataceae bacterium]|nr:FHA domain-containing protein [Gemmataceae bacterium]
MNKQSLDLFRESCGMTGPLQLRVEYPGVAEPLQWVLYQPFALIGREPRAHLQLDHEDVSRRHAYLQVVGGRVFFMDLESRIPDDAEEAPRRTGWLDEEQMMRIGPYAIRQTGNGQNGSAAGSGHGKTVFPGKLGLPEVMLEFVNKTGRSSTWQMTPLLALVGRSPECRVHLIGESVSSFHCSLVRTPLGVWVVDLFGKNGVRVNGQLVRHSRLEAGDQIQVGRFLIRVHYQAPLEGKSQRGAKARKLVDRNAEDTSAQHAPAGEASLSATAVEAPEVVLTPTIFPPIPAAETSGEQPEVGSTEMVPLSPGPLAQTAEEAHNLLVPLAHQLSLMQKQMFDQFQQAMMMMFQMFNSLQKDQIAVIREELDNQQRLTQELSKLQAEINNRATASPSSAGPAWARPQPVPSFAQKTAPPLPPKAGASSSQTEAAIPAADEPAIDFHLWLDTRVRAIQQERESGWKKIITFLSGK